MRIRFTNVKLVDGGLTCTEVEMLKAIYEAKRQGLLLAKLTPATANFVEDALAHAYNARMCPLFHTRYELHSGIEDPFDDAYYIPRAFVSEVLDFCEKLWLANQTLTFYDLESKFDRKNRIALIEIIRYAALSHKFDDEFYRTLLSRCPTEAHGCTKPLETNEISLES